MYKYKGLDYNGFNRLTLDASIIEEHALGQLLI